VGSLIAYRGGWEGRAYEDRGRILEVKRGCLFKSTYWSTFSGLPVSPENYNTVTYSLVPGDSTRLTVTQDTISSEEGRALAEGN
jgi:hypothetical protein